MVRSRAVSAPEPGQDREVAALRDTACAPRGSRIGVAGRRARPGPTLEDGCTVRFLFRPAAAGDTASVLPRIDDRLPPDWTGFRDFRVGVEGGLTTVHAAAWRFAEISPRLILLDPPRPLGDYAEESDVTDALSGGFFAKPEWKPLGEHRIDGKPVDHVPFDEPWAPIRPALHIDGEIRIAPRNELPADPDGDLIQAGPLLLRAGLPVVPHDGAGDPEGFASETEHFDEDITDGRLPRVAVATGHGRLIGVVAQGRMPDEQGLTLRELADVLAQLGAVDAMNLDGGASACLIGHGEVRNTPRESDGTEDPHGRPSPAGILLRAG